MPIIRDIIYGATSRGASLRELCESLHIAPDDLNDSEIKLPFNQACQSWEHAVRLTKDNLLGLHIGESSTPSILGMVGVLMQTSQDVLTAFAKMTEYSSLATDMFHYGVKSAGPQVILSYQPVATWTKTSPSGARHAVEQAMSGTLHVFYLLTAKKIMPAATGFKHKRTGNIGEYHRVFGSAIQFNNKSNHLIFNKRDLLTPVLSYDRSLFSVFEKMLREKKSAKNQTFAEQIKRIVIADFQGQIPSLELVAARMNMTPRTFQRRLTIEGGNFRSVLSDIQQHLSSELLKMPGATVTQVAQLLGYSDASAFRRARTKWNRLNRNDA